MAVIYKYPLSFNGSTLVPEGFVVHFGADPQGQMCVWMMHTDRDLENSDRRMQFYIVGTGHKFDDDHIPHASCVDGSFVWHLIEEWS